ncbi:MAG TPA: hypothetical protein VGD31_11345, partial [Sphingobacteriaceae bacterium]
MKLIATPLLIVLTSAAVFAQPKPPKLPKFNKNKEKEVFLKKQWFLGFKAGTNYSGVDVMREYSALSPSNYDISET